MKARIYKSHQREFECKLLDSSEMIKACALGNLLKKGEQLVVGDFVEIEQENNEYKIIKLIKRKNEIYRIIVRESKKKITASNCDYVVILMSVSKPAFKRGLLDRFLVRAFQWNVTPLIVFNKMDQYNPKKMDIEFEKERFKYLGVECFENSAVDPNYEVKYLNKGIAEFQKKIEGSTTLFLGHSGVGKSETINLLTNGEFKLKTKNVGKGGKGSHTTTWSEIIDFETFSLIDSPGIRSLSLDDILSEDLLEYFPDLLTKSPDCKFSKCNHAENAEGCGLRNPKDLDESDRAIWESRVDSYLNMVEELGNKASWENKYSQS